MQIDNYWCIILNAYEFQYSPKLEKEENYCIPIWFWKLNLQSKRIEAWYLQWLLKLQLLNVFQYWSLNSFHFWDTLISQKYALPFQNQWHELNDVYLATSTQSSSLLTSDLHKPCKSFPLSQFFEAQINHKVNQRHYILGPKTKWAPIQYSSWQYHQIHKAQWKQCWLHFLHHKWPSCSNSSPCHVPTVEQVCSGSIWVSRIIGLFYDCWRIGFSSQALEYTHILTKLAHWRSSQKYWKWTHKYSVGCSPFQWEN